jgi:predicted nucleic acid-binding Zn ribbon protein
MRIELNCAQCCGNRFTIEEDHADAAHVHCAECGHQVGTMAEVKERVATEVMKRSGEPRPLRMH